MDFSNENIVHIKKENIEYIQFKKLLKYSDIINHAYILGLDKNFRTARAKGNALTSEEYNLAVKSYQEVCDEFEMEYNNLVKTNQCHTNNVAVVTKKIYEDKPDFGVYKQTDALVTKKKDIILSTTNADCILLLFFDPVQKVIANVHSGWKGTLQRISVNTIKKMKEEFNCNPEDIICCMCPSIRKCHFEVDADVYELFNNGFQDLENLEEIIEKRGNKWHIDTILINKIILKREGLKEENIIDSGICSVCNKEYVHSYRAEKEGYGLGTAIISLK